MSLPEPDFISRDPAGITAEMVAQYERLTGKTLQPAQVERLLIDVLAYRESLVRIGIQEAAKKNLLAFAQAPMIDYLGELVGVTRLPPKAAPTILRFSLPSSQASDLVIEAGTRADGGDGAVTFATNADAVLPSGALYVDVQATCLEAGTIGNGWQPGQISSLVDDLGDIDVTVANLAVTAGGYPEEETDRLRERIRLAPEAFSTAGSRLAYVFHAKSAHQAIVDVAVLSPTPGKVVLYPLLDTGLPDDAMLALVEATCSAEKVRPLTDNVKALRPVQVDYTIAADLTLYATADRDVTYGLALNGAKSYQATARAGLGRDLVDSQVSTALQAVGVYRVALRTPALRPLAENEWANCTGITLNVVGVANG